MHKQFHFQRCVQQPIIGLQISQAVTFRTCRAVTAVLFVRDQLADLEDKNSACYGNKAQPN